jgi:hypothetical protein
MWTMMMMPIAMLMVLMLMLVLVILTLLPTWVERRSNGVVVEAVIVVHGAVADRFEELCGATAAAATALL